jgi:hypothetical protein
MASEFSVLQGNRLTRLRIQPNRAFATIPALRAPLSVLFDMVLPKLCRLEIFY